MNCLQKYLHSLLPRQCPTWPFGSGTHDLPTSGKKVSALLLLIGILSAARCLAHNNLHYEIKGLLAPAEIAIDRWGVPHIYARSKRDAFFLQGWNAARDRLWQIDLWRRRGLGELASVLGPAYVEQDKATRLFIYSGDVNQDWKVYGGDARASTEAFVEGINAYVRATRQGEFKLPVEFQLANYVPALWSADDVIRVRNQGIALNVSRQIERARLMCTEGGSAVASLVLNTSPSWKPIVPAGIDLCAIPPDALLKYGLGTMSFALSPLEVQRTSADRQGSNNWVLSGAKTVSGRPILANDPHRALSVVHLSAPGLNVIGAGEPALPGVTIGHNEKVAFGITVFQIAQEDLYVYETSASDESAYRYRNQWEKMSVRQDVIDVRGAPSELTTLKFTRHGPVIYEDTRRHRAYAVRAVWLEPGGAPYLAAIRYQRAQSLKEFESALNYWVTPGENFVFADVKGNIAWLPAGSVPIRNAGDGLLPVPGDGRYEWEGYLKRTELPFEINPSGGVIASANQMNLPADYPYDKRRVGFVWSDNYRFDRIMQSLGGAAKISLRESERLQNDYVSLPALRLMKLLSEVEVDDSQFSAIVAWLGQWDGEVTAESAQAAVFEVWCTKYLVPALLDQVAAGAGRLTGPLGGASVSEAMLNLLENPDDRLGVNPVLSRNRLLQLTLKDAVSNVERRLGPDQSKWKWGRIGQVFFAHVFSPLASEKQPQLSLNVGPAPIGGDGNTVGVAWYSPDDFVTRAGASFRMVLDVGRWDESTAINAPGQSGQAGDRHYSDLFQLWKEGQYFPLVFTKKRVMSVTETRMTLVPAVVKKLQDAAKHVDHSANSQSPQGR